MTDPNPSEPNTTELDDLRAEVERLRAQVDAAPETVPLETQQQERTGWWRPVAATDRYVESVAPLADDPAIQAAVTDRITTEITTRLQVQAVTQDAINALADRGLPPLAATSLAALSGPLSDSIEGFIHDQVADLVASDQFEDAWIEANR